jgi:hypothetical protein
VFRSYILLYQAIGSEILVICDQYHFVADSQRVPLVIRMTCQADDSRPRRGRGRSQATGWSLDVRFNRTALLRASRRLQSNTIVPYARMSPRSVPALVATMLNRDTLRAFQRGGGRCKSIFDRQACAEATSCDPAGESNRGDTLPCCLLCGITRLVVNGWT